MKKTLLTACILASSFLLPMSAAGPANGMQAVFMERLANFSGIVPSLWPRIAVDEEQTEVITLDGRERKIQFFNEHGMEIFSLSDDALLAGATDIDIGDDGNIYLVFPRREDYKILRLDYKGDLLNVIDLKNFPDDFQSLRPSFVQYRDGLLYLAEASSMDVAVIDTDGLFQKGYHLKDELRKLKDDFKNKPGAEEFASPERLDSIDMFGFWADGEGNIFFTVPVLFSVLVLPVDGEITFFGKAGGAPGKFGVIAGVSTDRRGNIYVTDRLRSVVLIFDSGFNFLTEFGARGLRPGSLIVPDDVVINNEEKLVFVGQAANRGVSVFRIVGD